MDYNTNANKKKPKKETSLVLILFYGTNWSHLKELFQHDKVFVYDACTLRNGKTDNIKHASCLATLLQNDFAFYP